MDTPDFIDQPDYRQRSRPLVDRGAIGTIADSLIQQELGLLEASGAFRPLDDSIDTGIPDIDRITHVIKQKEEEDILMKAMRDMGIQDF